MLLLKNSFIYVLTSLIPSIVGFLIVPFYLKYISLEEFGFLSVLMMINTFITIFATGQLHSSIVKYFLVYKDDIKLQKQYISTLLIASFIIAIFLILILFLSFDYIKDFFELDKLSNDIIVLSLSIAFINGFKVFFESINRILQHSKDILYSNIIGTFVLVIFATISLSFFHLKLLGLIIAMLISSISMLFYYVYIDRRYFIVSFNFKLIKEPLKFAFFLIPHTLSKNIYVMADRLVLVKFVSMGDVGIYALIDKVANILKLLTSNFGKAFTPFFMTNMTNGIEIDLQKPILITNYLFLGFLIGLTLFSNFILNFMKNGLEAYSYLAIVLSFSFIFKNLEMYLTNFLLENKQTKYISIISLSAAISNLTLNLIFIPQYGIVAATITTTISYIIGFLLAYYFVNIKFKYFNFPILKICIDFLIAIIFIIFTYFNQTLYGFVFIMIYLIYGYFRYFDFIKDKLVVKFRK